MNRDFNTFLEWFSIPRPNGSQALKETKRQVIEWLESNGIRPILHSYKSFPFFMEIGGVWLLVSHFLLAFSIWLRWGAISLVIAIISLAVSILETRGTHLLSRLVTRQDENIVATFEPVGSIERELLLSAHYDSKTDWLPYKLRAQVIRLLPLGMGMALLIGILGLIDGLVQSRNGLWSIIPYYTAILLTIPQILLFSLAAVNYMFGRFAPQSLGALDNGAACAVLLTLSKMLAEKEIPLQNTRITIVLFCGEELIIQGSRAYVRDRDFPYPTKALNLEMIGQNGDYIVWKKLGDPFTSYPSSQILNETIIKLIQDSTEQNVVFKEGPVGTDSVPFLAAGVTATSFASLDKQLGFKGIHSTYDNLGRVSAEKLNECLELVCSYIASADSESLQC